MTPTVTSKKQLDEYSPTSIASWPPDTFASQIHAAMQQRNISPIAWPNGMSQTNIVNLVKRKLNNDKLPIYRIRRSTGYKPWYAEELMSDGTWQGTPFAAWTKWGLERKLRNSLYVERFEP
jgi:hypothetical protein